MRGPVKNAKTKKIFIIIALAVLNIFVISLTAAAADDINGEAEFYTAVDYYAEKIRILHPNSILSPYGAGDYIEIYDNESAFGGISTGIGKSDLAGNISIAHNGEYMYALKAVSDEILNSYEKSGKNNKKIAALRKEKWYPIYGGGIDINKIIPARAAKNAKKQYYIAIRKSDDVFDTETGYKSRVTVLIKPRYGERDLNKFIEYDAEREKIILSNDFADGDALDIIYRYDFFDAISGGLTKNGADPNANISVPGKYFYLGGYVYISAMPIIKDGLYGPEVVFARSKEIKFKIPKVPAAPAVKFDLNAEVLVSLKKDVLEWSLTGGESPGAWQIYNKPETSVAFDDLFNAFPGLETANKSNNGEYAIYFRSRAVEKKSPASPPKKILIPIKDNKENKENYEHEN